MSHPNLRSMRSGQESDHSAQSVETHFLNNVAAKRQHAHTDITNHVALKSHTPSVT